MFILSLEARMSQSRAELNSLIVRAGAGAGKTRSLVNKVIETFQLFQREHQRAPHIVVSTFTRKATQELKERLLLRACELRDPALIEYMSDGARLHISTIHGLLSLFLRQVAHLTEIDPGFQILEEGASRTLRKQVLREALLEDPARLRWLETFGLDRLLHMCTSWGEAWLAQPGLRPASLQELEKEREVFAQSVRAQLVEWSRRLLQETTDAKWCEYARQLAIVAETWDGQPALLTLPKKAALTAKLQDLKETDADLQKSLKKIREACASPTWDSARWPEMARAWEEFHPLAQAFFERLQARKKNLGQFDMIDLEYQTLQLLREKPFLAESFAANWDYWMIDEFQDTSLIQMEILAPLIGRAPAYYVGDPQQSIYLFRGARAEIFMEQWNKMAREGKLTDSMRRNFRSESALLHFINDVVTGIGPQFEAMEPGKEGARESVARVLRTVDVEVERQVLVAQILDMVREGARLEQICILGRTHAQLMKLAAALKEAGLPTHVHSPSGFWQRRETQDVHALWRFLLNPHDNENLVTLLRSPFFWVPDEDLARDMSARPKSLWRRLGGYENPPEAVARLRDLLRVSGEQGVVAAFERALVESGVFDLALKSDPAGRKESNLWKFLLRVKQLEREGGSQFLSLEPSAFEDEILPEGDAASSQEPNCINLMTIHGSKGLEFDHVVIPHMGDAPRLSSTPSFCVEEARSIFSFPIVDGDDSSSVPSPLEKNWTEHRRELERQESLRWLYVALTRAKKSLILSSSEIKPDSWADRIQLFASPAGELTRSNYVVRIEDVNSAEVRPFAHDRRETPVRPQYQTTAQAPVARRRSVTAWLGTQEGPRLPAPTIFAIAQKKAEGVLVHRVLEALRFGQEPAFEDPDRLGAIEWTRALQTPPIEKLLRSGQAEWGFQIENSGGLLEGQIDLWGVVEGELWIVDYKSGSAEFKEKAFEQLALYGWALKQFGHREKMKLAVIYPLAQKFEVRDLTDDLLLHWENKFSRAQ